MAQYSHLAVYKSAYDYTLAIVQMTKNCPKEYKYSIAEKIQLISVDMILDIYRANSAADKIPFLKHLLENVEQLFVYMRLCHDLQIINIEKYTHFTENLNSIAKQTNGWIKACSASLS